MSNLFDAGAADRIRARLRGVRPNTPRRWGRMNAHQMVVHLSDGYRVGFREMEVTGAPKGVMRYLLRFAAFTLPLPWPRGVQTAPELDQEREGTPLGDFDEDVAELERLMDRYVATDGDLPEHPVWGRMSRGMAGRYAWRHMDHHLRQFGL